MVFAMSFLLQVFLTSVILEGTSILIKVKGEGYFPSPFSVYPFLACSFSNVVLINCYFPTDYHDDISFDAFTQCCFNLSRFVSSLQSNLRTYILGDFNCDPNIANERGTILSSCLPNFSVLPKSQDFTYILWSGSTANIDHVFSSNPSDSLPVDIVIEDFPVSDHMPLQFLIPPLASRPSPVRFSGNKLPKFF